MITLPAVYETERATLYHGDALRLLTQLPDAHVDAVVTDPPYSSGGFTRGDRAQGTGTKYSQSGYSGADLTDFAGDNRDQRGYLAWCALWMGEALRVTKPGGLILAFTDWRQLPTTTDAVQCGGWLWRGIVPWNKPTARPQQGRFTASSLPRVGEHRALRTRDRGAPRHGRARLSGRRRAARPRRAVTTTHGRNTACPSTRPM